MCNLISSLIRDVCNQSAEKNGQAQLDSSEILDYLTKNGRSYGINEESFYFGRGNAVARIESEIDQS
jgi:hypothetical protein